MEELTAKQEDFLLEQARDKDNCIEKCAFCREKDGVVPIEDSETLREIFICNGCDFLLGIIGIGYDRDKIEKENQAEELNPIKVKI